MNSDLGKKNIEAMEALVEQMTAEGDYLNPKVQKEEKKKVKKVRKVIKKVIKKKVVKKKKPVA